MSDHPEVAPVRRVPATIDLEDATRRPWDAVVVGAGPAGAAVATRLAVRGLAVLLCDTSEMPRPKLCGCCLSATALAELARLDALVGTAAANATPDGMPAGGLPLERVRLATAAVTAALPMPRGGVVSREALDAAGVRRAIAAGSAWLPRTRVTSLAEQAMGVSVALVAAEPQGNPLPAREITAGIVIVAAGLTDAIRSPTGQAGAGRVISGDSRLGLGTTLPADAGGPPTGELVMAVSQRGYCGVVRLEDGRVDLAAAVDRGLVAAAGGPAAALASLLAATGGDRAANLASPLAAGRLAAATYRGTPPLTRRRPVASGTGRVLRVGDAAGYVEPFTGEGMGWALVSARLCAEAVAPLGEPEGRLAADVAATGIRYARSHGRHFAAHHARCRSVSLVVRRPWLVGSALRLARLAPALAAHVVPLVVGGPTSREAHG